ncbi:MAG TPA: M36 family metallopeptidase [Herpetosiphonaceae bacterium]
MKKRSRRSLVLGSALPTLLTFLLALGTVSPKAPALPAAPAATTGSSDFLTAPQAGDALAIALSYVRDNAATYGLTAADTASLRVSDRYVSSHTGVTHIYLQQQLNGVDVQNGILNVNVMPDGRILNLGNRFVGDLAGKANVTKPTLSAAQAVERAAAHLSLTLAQGLVATAPAKGPAQEQSFEPAGIASAPINAKLTYDASGLAPRLAWNIRLNTVDAQHYWILQVDAVTGDVLAQNDLVIHDEFVHAEEAYGHEAGAEIAARAEGEPLLPPNPVPDGSSYRGYPLGVESPQHTTPAPPADGRVLLNQPADSVGSPFGWHDTNGAAGAEFTITRGNNAHAYTDTNNDDQPDAGSSPDGGAGLDFTPALDLTLAPSGYRPAAVVNLFLWNNYMHDVNYRYGFDEVSGNFQINNYGRGGSNSDGVQAQAQDGGGMNNANFATDIDGIAPRMQMYLWNGGTPNRDGDFDNGIISHEYGHGISTRLTGGPATASCLQNAEQMGEGWSDWQGLFLTQKTGDTGPMRRGIGTYALFQPTTGVGIRAAPYSTDMTIDPRTYNNTRTAAVPHGVGSIWTAMLWEMNWALINKYGFSNDFYRPVGGSWTALSGNQLAQQLITDGMKLQPCSPGFVSGRDAILAADRAYTGGVNQCLIWTAFAKRGLGFSASQGSTTSTADNTQAFDIAPACLTIGSAPTAQTICRGSNAIYNIGVGTQNAVPATLSATGNPAGTTATFNPNPVVTVPGNSTLTIGNTGGVAAGTYGIRVTATGITSTNSITVNMTVVASAPAAPSLTAPANNATNVVYNPTFTWAASPTATGYQLQVATDAAFNSIVYSGTTTTASLVLPVTLQDDTSYFWRVKASNVCGYGGNSSVFTFRTRQIPGTCPVNATPNVVYTTDFETGASGFTLGAGSIANTWALTTTRSNSGARSWYAQDPPSLSDQRLVSPPIVIPPASQSPITMRFQNRQAFETPNTDGRCWDAGILEVSTNGGGTWTQVPNASMLTDPYDALIWNDQAGNNPIGPVQAWCDDGDPAQWVNSVVNLDAYAGTTAQFRWRLGSDSAAGNEGWYIDDVSVRSCLAQSRSVSVSPDDADSGNVGTTVQYTVRITNTGSLSDTFNVAISGNDWTTTASQTSVTLNAGASTTVTVSVVIPANAANGEQDTATVTVTSQTVTTVSDSTTLVTTAVRDERLLYLPLLFKP